MAETVLITGASAGLGAGMARVFADRGADLAVTARRLDKLEELRDQAPRHPVFALPYADLDVAAAARAEDTTTLDRAARIGLDTLSQYSVPARPLVAPLNGALKGWMVDRVPRSVPVVLSDDALPGLDGTLYRRGERPVVRFAPDTLRPDADAAAALGVDETDSTALGLRWSPICRTSIRVLSPAGTRCSRPPPT